MDEPSLPNEPSPGGHVLGLEADRWKRGVRGAPSGSWPLHLTKPSSPDQLQLLSTAVSQSSSSGIQRTSRSHLPSLLPGSGLRTLLGGLFYLILLPRFPPSPNLHPLPPPRSQGTSLIQLLYARIEKARLFSTTLQCPHSPLSTTLSARCSLQTCTHPMFLPNSSESSNIPITCISVPSAHVVSLSAWKCLFLLFTFLCTPRGLAHVRPFPRSRRSFRPPQGTALCLSHSPCPLSILEVCVHVLFKSVSSALAEFES